MKNFVQNFFAALELRKFTNTALRIKLDELMRASPDVFRRNENVKSRAIALIMLELARRNISVSVVNLEY